MYLEDYHIHSHYSFDGRMTIDEILQEAIKKNISEVAITDHIELATEKISSNCFSQQACKGEIQNNIEKYQNTIVVKRGIELGNANLDKCGANKVSKAFDGDFILASVHNLKVNEDVGYYRFENIDCKSFYQVYLDAVYDVAQNSEYDVLAHITYPLKAIYEQTRWSINIGDFRKQFEKIFKVVINRGKGIEVNTSGLRVSLHDFLPNLEIIKMYRESGGTIITIGSDAHEKKYVGEGIEKAMQCIKSAGFHSITTFESRKPIMKNLEV